MPQRALRLHFHEAEQVVVIGPWPDQHELEGDGWDHWWREQNGRKDQNTEERSLRQNRIGRPAIKIENCCQKYFRRTAQHRGGSDTLTGFWYAGEASIAQKEKPETNPRVDRQFFERCKSGLRYYAQTQTKHHRLTLKLCGVKRGDQRAHQGLEDCPDDKCQWVLKVLQ